MKNQPEYPTISVIMPTLNCAQILHECLGYIRSQHYPQGKVEIVVADAGSEDNTIAVAKEYGAKVFPNPLKTSEAGKAIGVKQAKGELLLFLDSDNFIIRKDWLKRIVDPLMQDKTVIGSEPLWYTYRRQDPLISRYTSMMGLVDPLVYFTGNYDRYCILSGTWTKLNLTFRDLGKWLKLTLYKGNVPTLGSNGSLLRANLFDKNKIGDYLFDNDNIALLAAEQPVQFAKVKIGIVHKFSATFYTFTRKQRRRVKDFLFYQKAGMRKYEPALRKLGFVRFILYSVLVFPVIGQSVIGYVKKPDVAWFAHPILCWITLWVYGSEVILSKIRGVQVESRSNWYQTK